MKRTLFAMTMALMGIFLFASCEGKGDEPLKRPANIPAEVVGQGSSTNSLVIGAGATQSDKLTIRLDDFPEIKSWGKESYKWIASIQYLTGREFYFKLNAKEKGASIKKLTLKCNGVEYSFGPADLPYSPDFNAEQLKIFENVCVQLLAKGSAEVEYTIENGPVVIKNDDSKAELSLHALFKTKEELK